MEEQNINNTNLNSYKANNEENTFKNYNIYPGDINVLKEENNNNILTTNTNNKNDTNDGKNSNQNLDNNNNISEEDIEKKKFDMKNMSIDEDAIKNMSIDDIITKLKNEIYELEQCLNPTMFKINFSFLEKKKKLNIIFLWLIWLINITIYTTGDLSILFFSGLGTISYIFIIILCSCIVIIETLNIVNEKYHFFYYEYLLFSGYFWILCSILFKSLLNTKGWGWQFYLIMILINLNLIIIPKFNDSISTKKLKNN